MTWGSMRKWSCTIIVLLFLLSTPMTFQNGYLNVGWLNKRFIKEKIGATTRWTRGFKKTPHRGSCPWILAVMLATRYVEPKHFKSDGMTDFELLTNTVIINFDDLSLFKVLWCDVVKSWGVQTPICHWTYHDFSFTSLAFRIERIAEKG